MRQRQGRNYPVSCRAHELKALGSQRTVAASDFIPFRDWQSRTNFGENEQILRWTVGSSVRSPQTPSHADGVEMGLRCVELLYLQFCKLSEKIFAQASRI